MVADLSSTGPELRTRSVCKSKNKNTQGELPTPGVFSVRITGGYCLLRSWNQRFSLPLALATLIDKLLLDKAWDFGISRALAE